MINDGFGSTSDGRHPSPDRPHLGVKPTKTEKTFDEASRLATAARVMENRDNIAAKLTPADISKAQRMAREWLAKHGKAD